MLTKSCVCTFLQITCLFVVMTRNYVASGAAALSLGIIWLQLMPWQGWCILDRPSCGMQETNVGGDLQAGWRLAMRNVLVQACNVPLSSTSPSPVPYITQMSVRLNSPAAFGKSQQWCNMWYITRHKSCWDDHSSTTLTFWNLRCRSDLL